MSLRRSLSLALGTVATLFMLAGGASAAFLQRTCSNTQDNTVDVPFAAADTGSFVSKGCTYTVSLTLSGANSGQSVLNTLIAIENAQFTSVSGSVFIFASSLVLGEGSSLSIRNFTAANVASQFSVNGGLSHSSAFIAIINSDSPFTMMIAGNLAKGASVSLANVTQRGTSGRIQFNLLATCAGCVVSVSDSNLFGTLSISANNPETVIFNITRLVSAALSVNAYKFQMAVLDSRFGGATISTGTDVAYTFLRSNASSLTFNGLTFLRAQILVQQCFLSGLGIAMYVGVRFEDSSFTLLDSELVTSGGGVSSLSFTVSTTLTRVRIANNTIVSLAKSRAMSFSINSGDSKSESVFSNNTFSTVPDHTDTVMSVLVRYGRFAYDGLNRVVSAGANKMDMEIWDMTVPQHISIINHTVSSLRLGHLTNAIGSEQRGLSLSLVGTVVTGDVYIDFSRGASLEGNVRIDGLSTKALSFRLSPTVMNSTILFRNVSLANSASFPSATTVVGSCVGFVSSTFPGLGLQGMAIGTGSVFSFRNNAFLQPNSSLAALWVALTAGGRLQLDRSNALIGGSSLNVTCVGGGGAGSGWCPQPPQYGQLLLAPRYRGALCGDETMTVSVPVSTSVSSPLLPTFSSSITTRRTETRSVGFSVSPQLTISPRVSKALSIPTMVPGITVCVILILNSLIAVM